VLNIPAEAQEVQSGSLPPANRAEQELRLEASRNVGIAEAAVAVANAELKSADETVRSAALIVDRRKKAGGSPLEIEKAEIELKQAEADLKAKQYLAKLAATQLQLERTRLENIEAAQKAGQATQLPALPNQLASPLGVRQAESLVLILNSELKAAEAKLKAAQVKLERVSKLVADKLAAASEIDEAKLEVTALQAKRDGFLAQIRRAEAEAALEKTRMQPPPASRADPAPKPKGN
jgi:hypothetical protein